MSQFTAENIGSEKFLQTYGIRYAYSAGSMYRAIASKELVVKMANARLLSFLGTGGCSLEQIESDIVYLKNNLEKSPVYGANLLCNLIMPEFEKHTVDIFLRHGINDVEASAFMRLTPALVYYRVSGIHMDASGNIVVPHRILAKVSRPEVAEAFLSPPSTDLLRDLVQSQKLTEVEAKLAEKISMADSLCVEADSGGHTDQGVLVVLLPTIKRLRDEVVKKHQLSNSIYIGAAGGIGTPEAVAAAFIMGADFVTTGSINQCTVEAGVSDKVKSILQTLNIQDMAYAPAGDMFEIGAKIQVVRKGLLFPARANKLYQLYLQYNSLEEIDAATQKRIESQYFKRSFNEVWSDVQSFFEKNMPSELEAALKSPKKKMALIFRWYFGYTSKIAREGSEDSITDYQIHSGPAIGAFNQWVKGTPLENWKNRHVDEIAEKLMQGAASILNQFYQDS